MSPGLRRHAFSLALLGFCAPMAQAQAQVLITEYVEGLSNNKGLELSNLGASAVDISGWTVRLFFNGSSSAGQTISLSGSIAAGDSFVIANSSAIFAGTADLATGSLTFNGDDAVVVSDASDAVVDSLGQRGVDPGTEWGSDLTSTQDNTLRRLPDTAADTLPDDAFDPSVSYTGFATDNFDGLGCPGTDACESDPGPTELTRIYDIQGAGHRSPFEGEIVTTRGIVTAVRQFSGRGFYLQDPDGDGNLGTSDGVFVYTGSAPTVAVGDEVLVTATVIEYQSGSNLSLTELGGSVTVQTPDDSYFTNTAIAPMLLGIGGRPIPTEVVDNDTNGSVEVSAETTYDPEEDGIDFWESMEGMLLQVNDVLVVAPSIDYGEVWSVADNGVNVTGLSDRGTIVLRELGDGSVDYNPERIQIDDVLFDGYNPYLDVGATAPSVVGVLSYDFGNFELLPPEMPAFVEGDLAREVSDVDAGVDRLRIANYNVENLDPNDTDSSSSASGCPDTDVADGKFDAIAAQIVGNLASPDILALQEVQDSSGCSDDGVVSSAATLATLVAAVEAAGGPSYSATDIAPVDGADGGMPGGNIRVSYLYNADRVALVPGTLGAGGSTDATAPTTDAGGALSLTLSPGRIDPTNPAWDDSRKPLAAVWQFGDERIVTINNHFASKGGSSAIYGTIQPFINGSEDQRVAQAEVVNGFVDDILAVDSQAKVVALGDFNEFSFEDPMAALRGDGDVVVLTDLIDALLAPTERYTYSFEGNAQTLDHLLVSDWLLEAAPQIDAVHVNSEFVDQASDHDPVIASFDLPQTPCDSDVVSFATQRLLVDEGQGTVSVTLSRDGTACGAVSVMLSSDGGSATPLSDYLPLATTVSWGAGDDADKTVLMNIVDDSEHEGRETVKLGLSEPSRAQVQGGKAVLVIGDNDRR